MDIKAINDRMKASDYFVKLIKEAREAGNTKKKSISRACEIVKNETGFDLSDAIPKEYLEGYVPEINDDAYSKMIVDGIKSAIHANRKPTIKAITERKNILGRLNPDNLQDMIINLISIGEVVIDDSKRKPAYYLVNYHSRYKLPR